MLWRKNRRELHELEAELKELREELKQIESQNRQLSGQITIYKAARDFMNLLFYKLPECVMITDDKGRIMKANKWMQDLVGMSESELVGKHTVEISAGIDDLLTTQEAAIDRMARKVDLTSFESSLRHKDGTEVPVCSNITFVHDDNGKRISAVAVVRLRN